MRNGKNEKNSKLLMVENQAKWNKTMNLLTKCSQEEEISIIKQIDKINEELKSLKEIK